MFDYRFTRNAAEYTARLRKEAHNARLTRGTTSPLARFAARTFRTWANRIDGANRTRNDTTGSWGLETPRRDAHLLS